MFAGYDDAVQVIRDLYRSYNEENKRIVGLHVQDFGLDTQTGEEKILLVSQIISGSGFVPSAVSDYFYESNSYYCDGIIPPGGPFGATNAIEVETNFVMRPAPPPHIRYYFTGSILIPFNATSYPTGNPIDNFEDYYIYYGSSGVPGWTPCQPSGSCIGGTQCIEGFYSGNFPPDTEGDFYTYSLLDYVILPWLYYNNPEGRSFEICTVGSSHTYNGSIEIVQHVPKVKFGFKHICYVNPNYPAAIE